MPLISPITQLSAMIGAGIGLYLALVSEDSFYDSMAVIGACAIVGAVMPLYIASILQNGH